jgi:hypothetical protein
MTESRALIKINSTYPRNLMALAVLLYFAGLRGWRYLLVASVTSWRA